MIRATTASLSELYMADETAWLDAMAELIRAGQLGDLDYPHLAEYLEDMARRDRREVVSRLKILLTHLLKWTCQKDMRTASWQNTILNQQEELDDCIEEGVLKNHAEVSLAPAYPKAVKLAMRETKLPAKAFPPECPWTLDQLMSEQILGE